MASARRKPVPKGRVRVRYLPKDPLVARQHGLGLVEEDIECANPASGPTGSHAVVVDYNADLDTRFAPVKLNKNRTFDGMARADAGLLDDFRFHQVNVWAIVERTLAMIEDDYALARAIPWASGFGRLILMPHAGYDQNAFYDRSTGALHFFYFEGRDGKPVYTCLSHDIVAHELGHAILDGLKPYYNEFASPETSGFHEYFGDAMAMMASLNTRETALVVARRGKKLNPRNVVSAIASEFGAAIRNLGDDRAYLRGAWNNRKMRHLRGKTFEEHDWSELLTGIYYDLLEALYPKERADIVQQGEKPDRGSQAIYYSMRALSRASTITASVMFRGLDYCPPVDLRYDEYARAVLAADAVAYPLDKLGVRKVLARIFRTRGLRLDPFDERYAGTVRSSLRGVDIDAAASTPADAYRFLDLHRELFGIPYDANLTIASVYRTHKLAKSGFRPPREHIIEFVWSEDVKCQGERFGELSGTMLPLYCGGTLVFDSNGNFMHRSLVTATEKRRAELRDYAAYGIAEGYISVSDGMNGIGAPSHGSSPLHATIENGRARIARNAAMRHHRAGSSSRGDHR